MIDFKKYTDERENNFANLIKECQEYEFSAYMMIYIMIESDLNMIANILFDMRKGV